MYAIFFIILVPLLTVIGEKYKWPRRKSTEVGVDGSPGPSPQDPLPTKEKKKERKFPKPPMPIARDKVKDYDPEETTIFVSIASYRDPELNATLAALFGKARDPSMLRVTVLLQEDAEFLGMGDEGAAWYPEEVLKRGGEIMVIPRDYREARGKGERGAKDRRLERSDCQSNIPPAQTTNNPYRARFAHCRSGGGQGDGTGKIQQRNILYAAGLAPSLRGELGPYAYHQALHAAEVFKGEGGGGAKRRADNTIPSAARVLIRYFHA